MGMRYELDYEGHPAIRQVFEAPSVYLDHWAIRHFSDTRDDADRFVKALQSANGTLLVSVFNLIEFAPPSSEENARAAEKFLDTVLPNVFVSDLNIDRAVEFEAAHGLSMTPPADPDFMTLIGENPRAGLTDFSFGGWIRFIAESTEIEQSFTQYKNRLADTMNSRRMNFQGTWTAGTESGRRFGGPWKGCIGPRLRPGNSAELGAPGESRSRGAAFGKVTAVTCFGARRWRVP